MRRWLSNIEARLLDRHARNAVMAAARNCQTPGHSAITTRTKGATMTGSTPSSDPQPLTDVSVTELRPCDSEAPSGLTSGLGRLEDACRVMHDAYEAAAPAAGWKTQEASRKEWADVPEANKVTMRAAVGTVLRWVDTSECAHTALSKIYRDERDLAIQERDEARATIARMRTGRP